MILYHLSELAEFYNTSESELKNKTVYELEDMFTKMKDDKHLQEINKNANDEEFARLVRKYFTPFEFLKKWFSEPEIIAACSKHLSTYDLVQSDYRKEQKHYDKNAEYIGRKGTYMPKYDRWGRELAEKEYVNAYEYRVKNHYQGTRHGRVILDLLYSRYPALEEFEFNAYEYNGYGDRMYEIYPNNKVYTPFESLMSKDIDTIIKRNKEYAKSYNHGEYSVDAVKNRLASNEIAHYFDIIKNL